MTCILFFSNSLNALRRTVPETLLHLEGLLQNLMQENKIGDAFLMIAHSQPDSFYRNLSPMEVVNYLVLVHSLTGMAHAKAFDKNDFEWSLCNKRMLRNVKTVRTTVFRVIHSPSEKDYEICKAGFKVKTGVAIQVLFSDLNSFLLRCVDNLACDGIMSSVQGWTFNELTDRTCYNVEKCRLLWTSNDQDFKNIKISQRLLLQGKIENFQTLEKVIENAGSDKCYNCGDQISPKTLFTIKDNCPHLQCIDCEATKRKRLV